MTVQVVKDTNAGFHLLKVSGQFLDYAQSQRHSVRSTRLQANNCPFLVFLVDYFFLLFLRWRQPQVSKMLPAACHHVAEEVSEETPHRHPRKLHRAHHAQVDRGHLRAFVTAVVLDHFTQCRERSHLTFRKIVVYLVSPVLAIEKKGIRTIIYCLSFSRQTSSARYWSLRQCRSATPSCIKRNTSEP